MKCILCERKMMLGTKSAEGHICMKCRKKIPSVVSIKNQSKYSLLKWIEYGRNKAYEQFSETSSLGKLSVDEMHGLIRIGVKGKKDYSSIFHIDNIDHFAFTLKNITAKENVIYADILLTIDISKLGLYISTPILFNQKCVSERRGTEISYTEPSRVTMFRNVIRQMFENYYSPLWEKIITVNERKEGNEIEFAKRTLLLEDDFTMDDLKKHRSLLFKSVHPDNGGDDLMASKINLAYEILKKYKEM